MLSDQKCSLASDTSDPSDDVSNSLQSGDNDWTLVKYRGGTGGREEEEWSTQTNMKNFEWLIMLSVFFRER